MPKEEAGIAWVNGGIRICQLKSREQGNILSVDSLYYIYIYTYVYIFPAGGIDFRDSDGFLVLWVDWLETINPNRQAAQRSSQRPRPHLHTCIGTWIYKHNKSLRFITPNKGESIRQ